MNIKPGSYKDLYTRYERACAKMERAATGNTLFGGASALVKAKRLERMGCHFPAHEIVADVYSDSTGTTHPKWGAWECPECGQTHLGQEAAFKCCEDDGYLEEMIEEMEER